MSEMEKGTFTQEENLGNTSFEDWLNQFQLSPSTIQKYTVSVNVFNDNVKDINQENVNKFLKKHPRFFYGSALRHWFKFKEIKDIELPKINEPDRKPREEPLRIELLGIIESLRSYNADIYWLFKVLYYTGLRINEVLSMKLIDIDFDNNHIKILGKGEKYRVATIPKSLSSELKNYFIETKGILGNEKCFFTYSKNTKSAYENLKHRLSKSGIVGYELLLKTHNLRRAVVNEILDKTDGNVAIAQAFLDHSDIRTTMKYASERQKKKMKGMGEKIIMDE